jgi:aryl-alcohol dehydrogenase-like predicted oxidoreductase
MPIEGFATTAGTVHYRDRFQGVAAENHFRLEQHLWLSSIGIGTYLGNPDAPTDLRYREAVISAVRLGANVIDTAANYRFQRSERAIGQALQTLCTERDFERSEILLCTKGGYLAFDGEPPADVRRYVEETLVSTGVAQLSDIVGGSHCMTPRYLEHQVDQSLANLDVTCIDVYYIHNPESQLGAVSPDEFYERLRSAFTQLERCIAAGKIRMYGVASWNGFRVGPDERGHHSLERIAAVAREVAGDTHGFRFIQLPFSLAMPEALTVCNQSLNGDLVSVLDAAAAIGVTVVSSASISQGRIADGLPEWLRGALGGLATDAQTGIQFVRSTPGITTALVGMSHHEHVEENLQLVRVQPVSAEDFRRSFT